jgi:hypothetical protein
MMNTKLLIPLALLLLVAAIWGAVHGIAQPGAVADPQTKEVAAAAQEFLDTLDDAQRDRVVFDFDDTQQRARWSNLPVGIFERRGLRLGDLNDQQRETAWGVLRAALSTEGYEKVFQIVEADEQLNDGRRRGGPSFGRDEFFLSFLGQPSDDEPWTIQFGGHHLGINVTFAGQRGTLAPSHTGTQPARYELEGKTVRPLGDEVDKAFALINSLDETQRDKAVLGFEIRNLVLGPGRDGPMIEPEGIKGSDLSEAQREMLLNLAAEWTGIMPDAIADAKMEEMQEDVDETWFAWSGPTEEGSAAYFRIQGPTVFIEFAPQRMGGDATQHLHTIYRDPTNEYGKEWW